MTWEDAKDTGHVVRQSINQSILIRIAPVHNKSFHETWVWAGLNQSRPTTPSWARRTLSRTGPDGGCLVQLKRRLHDCVRLLEHKVMMTFVDTVWVPGNRMFLMDVFHEDIWILLNTRDAFRDQSPVNSETSWGVTPLLLSSISTPFFLRLIFSRQIWQIYCVLSWMSHINERLLIG